MRLIILILVFLVSAGLNLLIEPSVVLPPFFSEPLIVSKYILRDLSTVAAGIRRLGADITWIDLLQYYGSPEDVSAPEKIHHSLEALSSVLGWEVECHHSFEGGEYPELLTYCQRIVRLDENFLYAYQFGAGALAWNQNRVDEAIELLREAIEKHPREKIFPTYLAAVVYRKELKEKEAIDILLKIVEEPSAPNLVRVIVANYLEKQKNYRLAYQLWWQVWQSGDPMYRSKSRQKLAHLNQLLGN